MSLAPPVKVAPLIKFARWSLLSVGIVYGAFHQNRLSKRETARREAEKGVKAEREAQILLQKKAAADKEIKELEALASVKASA